MDRLNSADVFIPFCSSFPSITCEKYPVASQEHKTHALNIGRIPILLVTADIKPLYINILHYRVCLLCSFLPRATCRFNPLCALRKFHVFISFAIFHAFTQLKSLISYCYYNFLRKEEYFF